MPVYLWEGVTKRGEPKKDEMEAPDEAAVRSLLRRQGFKDIKIKKKPKDLLENVTWLQPKVKEKDVVVFARQFATMINAGLPIVHSLDLLAQEEENKTFNRTVRKFCII